MDLSPSQQPSSPLPPPSAGQSPATRSATRPATPHPAIPQPSAPLPRLANGGRIFDPVALDTQSPPPPATLPAPVPASAQPPPPNPQPQPQPQPQPRPRPQQQQPPLLRRSARTMRRSLRGQESLAYLEEERKKEEREKMREGRVERRLEREAERWRVERERCNKMMWGRKWATRGGRRR